MPTVRISPSGGSAEMAFDGNPATIWHTRWTTGTDPYPHEIQIDLSKPYNIHSFTYSTRTDGVNGRIKNYELYLSNDKTQWGTAVSIGVFTNTSAPQTITFESLKPGRYFRLKSLSEVNGGPWTSAAEFTLTGCNEQITGLTNNPLDTSIKAFPIPARNEVNIALPSASSFNYSIYSTSGIVLEQGKINSGIDIHTFNLQHFQPGFYFIQLTDNRGIVYRIKIIKQ